MDIATFLGMICSFAFIIIAMTMGQYGSWFERFAIFIDIPSIFIVFGGTIGAALTSTPITVVGNLGQTMKNAFLSKNNDTEIVIDQFMDYANRARREGILALESAIRDIPGDYLKKGLQLTVDGLEPEVIESIMNAEIENMETRHQSGIGVIDALATFAPALGMIGTVIGLVRMLKTLDDPSTIGPAMAIALITTFYGAILANLVFIPLANKLRTRSAEEVQLMEMQLEGILSIARGENPRLIQEKLSAYLPPKQRKAA